MQSSNLSLIKSILFSIALFDFMGFTIAATVFPSLLINPSSEMLSAHWSHDVRLMLVGALLACYPLGQFLSASILGAASDKWGRRKVLIVTLLGTFLSSAATCIAIGMSWIFILFASRFLSGLLAGNVAVAQASIVDISNQQNKASNISLIQLSLGLAWVFGAPIGGFLSNSAIVSWFNYSTPFLMLTLGLLIILIAVIVALPETLKTFKPEQKINFLKSVQLSYEAISVKRYRYIFLVWMLFICGWAMFLQFLPAFLILNFNYQVTNVAPMLAFMGGTFACTQIFLARKVLSKITPETALTYFMLVPGLVALGIVFINSRLELHILAFLFPFCMGFTLPSLLAAISNKGKSNEQGKMLGMAQSLQALMTIIATVVGGQLLAINSYLSTIIAGSLMCAGWMLLVLYKNSKLNSANVNAAEVSNG